MTVDMTSARHADSAERGRAARKAVPLTSLGELRAADEDPVALLEKQSVGRVPELIPVRYGRMLISPFTFYRGAALLMAADLANGPRSPLTAQLCGDAHLSNFGLFASPERRLVFDVNDFDETNPGPFEWDVKRLVASLEIAARDNGHSSKERRRTVMATARAYRTAIREFAAQGNMPVWYAHQAIDPATPGLQAIRSKKSRRSVRDSVRRAYARDSLAAQRKLTERVDGRLRIVHDPPVIVPVRELDTMELNLDLDRWMKGLLNSYAGTLQPDRRHLIEQYRVVDVAHKVVGVGSVGARAWIVLLLGVNDEDPLFLQAKEAQGRFWRPTRRAVATATTDAGSWKGSGSSRHTETSCSAGTRPSSPAFRPTTTSVSCGTGRAPWKSPISTRSPRPIRRVLRQNPGPRPRPLGRPGRDRVIPRRQRRIRERSHRFRERVRR